MISAQYGYSGKVQDPKNGGPVGAGPRECVLYDLDVAIMFYAYSYAPQYDRSLVVRCVYDDLRIPIIIHNNRRAQ